MILSVPVTLSGYHLYPNRPIEQGQLITATAKSGLQPVFVNTALQEHSHTHCLPIICGCFGTTRAELSVCNRDHVTHKAKNIYYLSHSRKSWQTPATGLSAMTDMFYICAVHVVHVAIEYFEMWLLKLRNKTYNFISL